MLGGGYNASLHGDQLASFRSSLLRVSTLQVTREHNPGPGFVNDLSGMHMAESKVVVTLVAQHLKRGGSVSIVSLSAGQTGMQNSNVKTTRQWSGIQRDQVFEHCPIGKAAAMDRHAEFLQIDGLALLGTEDLDPLDVWQLSRDLA